MDASYGSFRFPAASSVGTTPRSDATPLRVDDPDSLDSSLPRSVHAANTALVESSSPPLAPVPIVVPASTANQRSDLSPEMLAQPIPEAAPSPKVPNDATPRGTTESPSTNLTNATVASPRFAASSMDSPSPLGTGVNRAPPRALTRRASMVSFRLSGTSEPEQQSSTPQRDVATPNEVPAAAAAESVVSKQDNNSFGVPSAPLPEYYSSSVPEGGHNALDGPTSASTSSAASTAATTTVDDASGFGSNSPPQISNATTLAPTPTTESTVRRVASPQSVGSTPRAGPSTTVVDAASPHLLTRPISENTPAAKVSSPREAPKSRPTPRSGDVPSTPRERPIPVVPERASHAAVLTKFQNVVRQTVQREKVAQQQEAEDHRRRELQEISEARKQLQVERASLEAEKNAFIEARQAWLNEVELEKRKIDDARQAWQEELRSEQQKLERDRGNWALELEDIFEQRRQLEITRTGFASDREALDIARIKLERERVLLDKQQRQCSTAPERSESIMSPSRDEFARIDPRRKRDIIADSVNHAAFTYEPPAEVPLLLTTSREASESRSRGITLDESARVSALRNFEPWYASPRAVLMGITEQRDDEYEDISYTSTQRLKYLESSSPKSKSSASPRLHDTGIRTAKADASAQDFVDIESTAAPSYRLFPRRR